MAKYRQSRINEEMFKEAAQIIRTVKDPRVSEAFVSVTGVEVTPDLKFAKIYYSAMQGDKKTVKKGLDSSAPYIRGQLAKNLNLRITPELTFEYDNAMERGASISELLKKAAIPEELERDPELTEAEGEEEYDDENQ
jgi:ribosome-binding factor A